MIRQTRQDHRRRRLPNRGAVLLATAALALGLNGCGSRLSSAELSGAGASSSGLGGSEIAGGQPGPGDATNLPLTRATPLGGGDGATTGNNPAGQTQGTSGPLPSVSSGPLSTSPPGAPVEVGIAYVTPDSEAALGKAVGANSDPGNAQQQAQAVISWLNKQGGVAGHKIIPIYYGANVTGSETYAQMQSDMCALWSQDHHVVAAFADLGSIPLDDLSTCLARAHAVFYNSGEALTQQSDYSAQPSYVNPDQLSAERFGRTYVDNLKAMGYFGTAPKIGIVAYDYSAAQRALNAIKDELGRVGLSSTDTYTIAFPGSLAQLSDTLGQEQAATTRFHAEGIDHVLSVLPGGIVSFFMQYAENQNYRPRYGVTTLDRPYITLQNSGVAPQAQLAGAVGPGWRTTNDVDGAHDPKDNPSAAKCAAIFASSGAADSWTKEGQAYPYCDFGLLLHAAEPYVARSLPLTGSTLLNAINRLGSSFRSALTPGTFLSSTRHDGVSAVRPLLYNAGCHCFAYVGSTRPTS